MPGKAQGQGWDLHTHSVLSDGTTTPTEIARLAAASGLSGFALTDHDTVAGWDEARDAARASGIGFIPGMEVTCDDAGRSRHLLAYYVNPAEGELFAAIEAVRRSRLSRAKEMVRRLQRDYKISWDALFDTAGDAVSVGRPHIADALVAAGYATDRGDAFARILHPGSPYYLDTLALNIVQAIRLVREAGGVPVLAHPAAVRQRQPVSAAALTEYAAAGLIGVEVQHPEHVAEWQEQIAAHTAELGLCQTGASDYHGEGKPNRLGECTTPFTTVAKLAAAAGVSLN